MSAWYIVAAGFMAIALCLMLIVRLFGLIQKQLYYYGSKISYLEHMVSALEQKVFGED